MHTLTKVSQDLNDIYGGIALVCGEGWADLLYVAGLLIREEQTAHHSQDTYSARGVKEKFGELRIHIFNAPDPIYDYIEAARLMSIFTCETCGSMTRIHCEDRLVIRECSIHTPPFRTGLNDVLKSVETMPPQALDLLHTAPEKLSSFALVLGYILNNTPQTGEKTDRPLIFADEKLLLGDTVKGDSQIGRYMRFLSSYSALIDR